MNKTEVLINDMYNGNTEAILFGISSKNDYIIMNAILAGTQQKIREKRFIEGVMKAQKSKAVLMGFPLASVAIAAEHFLVNKRYTGKDEVVKDLIENKFVL